MSQTKIVAIETTKKKVAGTLNVDGIDHEVLQLGFGQNQRLLETDGTGIYLGTIYAIIREVIPTLTKEQIDNIALPDGEMIMVLAGAGVKAVEAMFPNAVKSADPTSAV